jgi:hypothetical protein
MLDQCEKDQKTSIKRRVEYVVELLEDAGREHNLNYVLLVDDSEAVKIASNGSHVQKVGLIQIGEVRFRTEVMQGFHAADKAEAAARAKQKEEG